MTPTVALIGAEEFNGTGAFMPTDDNYGLVHIERQRK
jgi:hypothetical protein